ncbi:TetR/AcrR family transcriptional regulator [Microtetraspora malaysiensis]|uniref:TetR/AcrR family transcriptional regulator n=1 Tax=Microtetraspora malaysiensis TaxID=161358 RepID=UPI003D8F32BD
MERADAARNRARILEAAALLFAERSPQDVTMDDIAKKAGVGRGTLYRRYPDRASIAVALLDEHERDLQERLLRGEPPLGPGAPPAERLAAFYTAMVRLLEDHSHLVLGSEVGRSRFETGAYGFWRAHVRTLLTVAGTPGPDALVDVLLAPLAPEVYGYQRTALGLSPEQIAEALARLTRALGGPGSP